MRGNAQMMTYTGEQGVLLIWLQAHGFTPDDAAGRHYAKGTMRVVLEDTSAHVLVYEDDRRDTEIWSATYQHAPAKAIIAAVRAAERIAVL